MSTKIVIDCDPGHDDAMAILLALASPELELVGVTTVAGNQTLDKTTRNALVTLEVGGRSDIPVAAGADAPLRRELRTAAHVHGETGLDGPELPEPSAKRAAEHAADFLAELIEPGAVLVPMAPLTNIALLLERYPDVRDRIDRIVWMGGAIAEGNITPAAEFNAFVDPEAAAAVFASEIPITMIGLDVTHKPLFTRAHAEQLREAGRAGRFVAELSDFFQRFHERSYGFEGSPIHDAMAVAHVIDPTLVTTRRVNVAVETRSELCDGRTVVDLRGVMGVRRMQTWGSTSTRSASSISSSRGSGRCHEHRLRLHRAAWGRRPRSGAAPCDAGARPSRRRHQARSCGRRDAALCSRRGPLRRRHIRNGWRTRDRSRDCRGVARGASPDPRRLVRRERPCDRRVSDRLGRGDPTEFREGAAGRSRFACA